MPWTFEIISCFNATKPTNVLAEPLDDQSRVVGLIIICEVSEMKSLVCIFVPEDYTHFNCNLN